MGIQVPRILQVILGFPEGNGMASTYNCTWPASNYANMQPGTPHQGMSLAAPDHPELGQGIDTATKTEQY